ncbi:MAG: transposase [Dehalococcoidia bacterium]|nr:transposase [Dehalococcoidia bacterium]
MEYPGGNGPGGYPMRGRQDPQVSMLAFMDLEARVPAGHPLRVIKVLADEALRELSFAFDGMYAEVGRPSIPPEWLLKSSLLIALYSVRSERAFCEQLSYNLLFRWTPGCGSGKCVPRGLARPTGNRV